MENHDNSNNLNKTSRLPKFILDLVMAGLEKNTAKIEVIAVNLATYIKKSDPELAGKLRESISHYSLKGSSFLRGVHGSPMPTDSDTHLEMATVIHPDPATYHMPILDVNTKSKVDSFLEERKNVGVLLERGIKPSNCILLIGHSGTGKTMMAYHIASTLNKPLIVLDLSTSVSSLLGKTGHNLKRVFDFAKHTASVLLLDEFDAIAKRRDDNTDLGEIKRVVNILLMELENWPTSSILIATSNHPELLDRAIWRRFDHVLEIPVPDSGVRTQLLLEGFGDYLEQNKHTEQVIYLLTTVLDGRSAADICKFVNNVKRRTVLSKDPFLQAALKEASDFTIDKKIKPAISVLAHDMGFTYREISELTGLSLGGIQHQIKTRKNGRK